MIELNGKCYKEIRCAKCRKLLGLEYIYRGRLVIKCRCGEYNHIDYKTPTRKIDRLEAQEIELKSNHVGIDLEGGVQ